MVDILHRIFQVVVNFVATNSQSWDNKAQNSEFHKKSALLEYVFMSIPAKLKKNQQICILAVVQNSPKKHFKLNQSQLEFSASCI